MATTDTISRKLEDILQKEGLTVIPKDSAKEVDGYRVEYAESSDMYMIVRTQRGHILPTGKLSSLFQSHQYNTEIDTILKVWPK